jgi:NCAIR mutase (PurE)-related protein
MWGRYSLSQSRREDLGAPPKTAAAVLPVSAAGLGLPVPTAFGEGSGSTALWHGLQSCLALGNRNLPQSLHG